jgi:hypothetical protein
MFAPKTKTMALLKRDLVQIQDPLERRAVALQYIENFRFRKQAVEARIPSSSSAGQMHTNRVPLHGLPGCTCTWATTKQRRQWQCPCSDKRGVHQRGRQRRNGASECAFKSQAPPPKQ